jgi:ribosomal protein S18 acetylase RimI-like enzyme
VPADAPRAGALVDAAGLPSDTRRLLTAWATSMAPPGAPWNPGPLDWATRAVAEGRLAGRLWVGPGGDEAVGVALGIPAGDVGGRVEVLFLAPEFRSPASVRAFLAHLDAPDGFGPLLELPDPPRDHDAAAYASAARGLGLIPVERIDMRYPAARAPPSAPSDPAVRIRTVRTGDLEAVAGLTVRAYSTNPVDVALFRRHHDPLVDARAGTAMLFGTAIGPWLDFASFLIEDSEGVVGATVVNDHAGALITQVMVDPRARGRGHATRLLGATVAALRAAGRSEIRLVVTRSNRRAERLYEHLGFVSDPTTAGATWLHVGRLGLSERDLAGT